MTPRRLGATELSLSPIGFGAFKIGRNQGTKYDSGYDVPGDDEVARLIGGLLDLGITYFDTAPAYGTSEERLGQALPSRREGIVLSTKVGEIFENGVSRHDFSPAAIAASLERSRSRLRAERLDLVFVHSDGADEAVLAAGPALDSLRSAQERGIVGRIGFSGKTVEGFRAALALRYDALMVEYHPHDARMKPILDEAFRQGVGVVVKKPLASGRVRPEQAIPFGLAAPAVASLAIGGLRLERFADHVRRAE